MNFRFTLPCLLITATLADAADYSRDIQPLFAEHCLECHGPDDSKGGLVLTTRNGALKELKSGAKGIVPGDIAASELIKRVTTGDLDDRMPPKAKKPLKASEVELLKTWVKDGAKFDLHWAYKPVVQPPLPDVKTAHPIDRLVRAQLAEKGIDPSPEADRHTLIKRVHYDLLGLPPAPEAVDAFVKDNSPRAYETMVDRVLSNPHYGERWGRHWLDAARYADSDGYEKDRPRPDAWRYRDWVIRAVNDDMPFDQFSIEQIAGDLLPDAKPEQIVATAFHRQTLTNTEGGTDQEQFRIEAVMDRTETTGAVWLGLTVGCARCHTHKYDQITQREYYQLFGFYNNGDEVTRQVPVSPEAWSAYEQANGAAARQLVPLQQRLDTAKAKLPSKLPDWEKSVQARLAEARRLKTKADYHLLPVASIESASNTSFKKLADGSHLTTGKTPRTDVYTLAISATDKPVVSIKLEVLPDETLPAKGSGRSKNGNFVLSEIKLLTGRNLAEAVEVPLHSAKADHEQKSFNAALTMDGNSETGWAIGGQTDKPHQLTLQLATPVKAGSGNALFVRLEQISGKTTEHTIGRFRLLGSSEVTEESIGPADVVKILGEEPKRRNPVVIKPLWDWLEKVDPEVLAAARALDTAKSKLPKPPLMDARVIASRSVNPRPTHLLYRGDFLQPKEEVTPATLAVLQPLKAADPKNPSRLDFARWLVSAGNPLTPRVTVNSIWAKLFGEGLVTTTADFGVRGAKPKHPELLDWLAGEFMKQGWSRKKLLRVILTSATYRQASKHRPEMLDVDPKNELLWRQNRLRVEGEIVRDLHLAASGLLSPRIGGESVFPPMPADVAALSYAGNFSWKTSTGPDRYRRGLYTFFKRTAPYPDLTTFDCPDANTTNVKRGVSNTPLQALTTLNAEAYAEAAQALARRVITAQATDDRARLDQTLRFCVTRPGTDHELKVLGGLLEEARSYYRGHADEAKLAPGTHTTSGVTAEENAAWVAVARIVLNMDEFITRE